MSYLPLPGTRAAILISTLQTDSVAFSQATGRLLSSLISGRPIEPVDITDFLTGLSKVSGGLAELAKADSRFAAIIGPTASLVDASTKALLINKAIEVSGTDSVKVADALAVLGGVADLGSVIALKPGPLAPLGIFLKGTALIAGAVQIGVGDMTIGDLTGSTPSSPLIKVPMDLIPQAPNFNTSGYAPDGAPLNQTTTSSTANARLESVWTKDSATGAYTRTETVVVKSTDGQIISSTTTLYKYDSDGAPRSAEGFVYDGSGNFQRAVALVPDATGQSWITPSDFDPTSVPPRAPSSVFVTFGGANSHTATLNAGGTLSDILLLQGINGNAITLDDILTNNPGITNVNNIQAGVEIRIPQRQGDELVLSYANGVTVSTNKVNGEYHMIVPNNSTEGGFTLYQRSVDGDAGYIVRQTSTNLAGDITFAAVGFQATLDAEVKSLSTFSLNGTGSYDAATAVNGSVVTSNAQYDSTKEAFSAEAITAINGQALPTDPAYALDPQDLEAYGFVFNKPLSAAAQALITGLDPATQATTGAPAPQLQTTALSEGQTWRALEVAGGTTFSTLRDDDGNVISATYSRQLGAGVTFNEVYDAANKLLYSEKIEPILSGANAGQIKETLIRPDGSGFIVQRGADGQFVGETIQIAPFNDRLATTFNDLPGFINALKGGQPLPILANGLRLLNNIDQLTTPGGSLPQLGTANTIAAGALSLYNLNNALKNGDDFDKLSTTAFALNGTTNALVAAGVITKTSTAASLLGAGSSFAKALPYLGLISALKNGDPVGAAMSIGMLANPAFLTTPLGWALIAVQILTALFEKGPPDAWGTASVSFGEGLTNYGTQINTVGENFGPDRVRTQLQNTLSALNGLITQHNAATADSTQHLGLIPQRLPSLNFKANEFADKGYAVTDIDALTGAQRYAHIRFDDSGQVFNLEPASITPELQALLTVPGASGYPQLNAYLLNSALARQAIAPMWEVQTARMQETAGDPNAGLTEEERAAKAGLGAAVDAAYIATHSNDVNASNKRVGHFMPVGLDLDQNSESEIILMEPTDCYKNDSYSRISDEGRGPIYLVKTAHVAANQPQWREIA